LSEAADAAPAVSLVVVNHQGAEQVVACLASLLEAPGVPVEVFAVDNASDDGSLEAMRAFSAHHPEVEVVASPTNLGYAGALNLVLDRCAGRYVGLFNMDIVAEPGWLAPLVEHLDASPNVAAVNPMLLLDDGARVNATGLELHVTAHATQGAGRLERLEVRQAVDVGGAGEVGLDRDRFAPGRFDFLGDRPGTSSARAIAHHHVGAGFGETPGDAGADALAGTGHQHGPAGEIQ